MQKFTFASTPNIGLSFADYQNSIVLAWFILPEQMLFNVKGTANQVRNT